MRETLFFIGCVALLGAHFAFMENQSLLLAYFLGVATPVFIIALASK